MKQVLVMIFVITSLYAHSQTQTKDYFSDFELLTFESLDIIENKQNGSNGPIYMQFNGYELELIESQILTDDYQHVNQDGESLASKNRAIPYHGFTSQGGKVALTIGDNFVYGYIEDGSNTYFVEPLNLFDKTAKPNEFVWYNSKDVIEKESRTCGADLLKDNSQKIPKIIYEKSVAGLCYEIEYGICNDYSMFTKYGSAAQVESYTLGIVNNINTNYDTEFADELKFVISGQLTINCSTCDPWTGSTNPSTLLPNFANWCNANLDNPPYNIDHDVATLFSNRNFDGSTVGLAYKPGVCSNPYRYNIIQDHSLNAAVMRVTTAHELGHNFDATHDSTTGFIMSPSVNITNTWSAASVSDIINYYNSVNCLSICANYPDYVEFENVLSSVNEQTASSQSGPCLEPYVDISIPVQISSNPSNTVLVLITLDAASTTATNNYDFENLTPSITFTTSGPIEKDVIIRVYDDKVEELTESIVLNLNVVSGNAINGPIVQHTVNVQSIGDIVSDICCSGGGEVVYGYEYYSLTGIFMGNYEDSKSRFLLTAAQLQSLGLVAGYIDQMSLNVYEKTSSGIYNDFRIGFKSVTETNLNGVPWYATSTVFEDNISTILDWNDFEFQNSFYWDGTSNLYIDVCFDNNNVVGYDKIIGFPVSPTMGHSFSYQAANDTDGCSLPGNSYSYYNNIQPWIKLKQPAGAQAETAANNVSKTRIKAGETAHFYTDNDLVIASVKNLGNIDIECIELKTITDGTGKQNLSYGSAQYTDKTFEVTADNDASYELSLYYDVTELNVWGSEQLNLNFIQSSVPIQAANESNSEILESTDVETSVGAGDIISYKTTVFGSGFFALTDEEASFSSSNIGFADLAITEHAKGILLTNNAGNVYLLNVDNAGQANITTANSTTAGAFLENGNLALTSSGKSIILYRNGVGYVKLTVDNDGNIQTNTIASLPAATFQLNSGNFWITNPKDGVVLKNMQNECWKLFVSDAGDLVSSIVSCP